MNVQPVIHRELRAAARRRETWRARLFMGGGAVLAVVFAMLLPHVPVRERGLVILICLSITGFVFSLFAGAALTADAISSEKREGTLGLLFLTPLRGWEIVTGKMAMHSVQVGYALIAGFPFFFLPILLGGVVWAEVARIILVMLVTLGTSLSMGMFFSTMLREAREAVLATASAMLLLALVPWAPWLLLNLAGTHTFNMDLQLFSPMTSLIFAFETNFHRRFPGSALPGPAIYWASVLFLLLLSAGLVLVASWQLPQVWKRLERGERASDSTAPPAAGRTGRRKLPGWALPMDRAPLVWLAAHGAKGPVWLLGLRIAVFCFFALMLLTSVTTNRSEEEYFIAAFCASYGLHLISRTQWILAATRRIQEDRQSGALEAILATPVTDREIIGAQKTSFTRLFRKQLVAILATNALLELAVITAYRHLHMGHGAGLIFSVLFIGGGAITLADFWAIRWLGLRESLRHQSQLKTAGRVFLKVCVYPWVGFALAFLMAISARDEGTAAAMFFLWATVCMVYLMALAKGAKDSVTNNIRRLAADG
jgi:ABC-type transport system involved in multi-copper enzyme maturation permease subunit